MNFCHKRVWDNGDMTDCGRNTPGNSRYCDKHMEASAPATINPKDALGKAKPPLSVLPCPVLYEIAAGCLEGAFKYRRHNYRVAKIQASVYYDAAMRHLMAYWEGEDIDPDSGINHISKAMACLFVFRDAMMNDMVDDDRPPKAKAGWMDRIQLLVDAVFERHPNPLPPYTELGNDE